MNNVSRDIYDIMESQPTHEYYIEIYDETEYIEINKSNNNENIEKIITGIIPYCYIKFYDSIFKK